MSDESKVNIDALADFGKKVGFQGMLKDFGDGLSKGPAKINNAVIGFSGTNEAQVLRDYYVQVVLDSAGQFNQDVVKGLMSMGYGSIVEAANYREGDLSQAKALQDVQAAFDPKPGTQSVATDVAAADAKQRAKDAQQARIRHQTGDDRLPPADDTPDNVCLAPSPAEQVRNHDDLYGKDEHWHPADPDADKDNVQLVDPPPPGGWPDTTQPTVV